MAKGKRSVRTKKISTISKDDTETLNNMFAQMTGMTNADVDVIIPKILNIKRLLVKYHKIFLLLSNLTEIKACLNDYRQWLDEIQAFMGTIIRETGIDTNVEYSTTSIEQILQLQSESEDNLNKMYKDLKNCHAVKQIIITTSNLANYKKDLKDQKNINDRFIKRSPGFTLAPLSFSALDLKTLWGIDALTENSKKFILTILHHAYNIGYDIYDITSSPDVDIKKFSQILVESISKLRKQIPRCNKAFDVIENSIKLLEGNFKNYYRSSIAAENPAIIVENFISDVSKTQTADRMVTMQFKRIVLFLKERSSGITDPKVKNLFSMLNTQFNAMDKELGVKISDPDTQNEGGEFGEINDVSVGNNDANVENSNTSITDNNTSGTCANCDSSAGASIDQDNKEEECAHV